MLGQGTAERPEGRVVAWSAWGNPAGRRLLQLHGTPGSRLGCSPDPRLFERLNVHVVTFDRPGYGRSSVQRDRTILSVADDALAVADAYWALSTAWGFELAEVAEVAAPVHMWYGELDRNLPIGAVQAMASQLTVESFEILPGAGHLGWRTDEERVLRTLLDHSDQTT